MCPLMQKACYYHKQTNCCVLQEFIVNMSKLRQLKNDPHINTMDKYLQLEQCESYFESQEYVEAIAYIRTFPDVPHLWTPKETKP